MKALEKLAHNIAEKISVQIACDQDKTAVIAYGLTAMFQMAVIFTAISIIGILSDFWYESIVIFFGVGIIRKSTGGAHARTMYGCILISILSIVLLSALSRYGLNYPVNQPGEFGITLLVFLSCFVVFYIRVPVDSPNKPIVKPEKIKRLRKQSFRILVLLFFVSINLIIFKGRNSRLSSIANSIKLTLLWQAFTLTKTGIRFFDAVDSKWNRIAEGDCMR